MHNSFAILVLTCDKYSDLWPAFFKCFRQNFPAGDWPVYLGSNTKECHEPNVITVLSGDDTDWSSSFKRILQQIPEKKIFVILEDIFISSKTDENTLKSVVNFMFEKDANLIRYRPPAPDLATDNPLIGECLKGAPYRATVCGFWDRDYLLGLLLEGENPWNFEILGSYRTSYSDRFYAMTSPLFEFQNMIEKGQWVPVCVNWASQQGIPIDLEARPVLKGGGHLRSFIQMKIYALISYIPWQYRVRFMNQLRKLFISY